MRRPAVLWNYTVGLCYHQLGFGGSLDWMSLNLIKFDLTADANPYNRQSVVNCLQTGFSYGLLTTCSVVLIQQSRSLWLKASYGLKSNVYVAIGLHVIPSCLIFWKDRNLIGFSCLLSRFSNVNSSTATTMKAARAALMLVPILGLHFMLLPMRPKDGSALEYVYEVVSSVTSSFQVKIK